MSNVTAKKMASRSLATFIAQLVLLILSLPLELSQFNRYLDTLPEKNLEGLAALGIVVLWIVFAIAMAVTALMSLIAAVGLFGVKKRYLPFWITGIVSKILCAAALVIFVIVMWDVYPAGVLSKVLYGLAATVLIALASWDIVQGKQKKN